MKKIQRLNVAYDPLHVSFGLVVKSGSLLQVHSAETNEYVPDRSITPLVLSPKFYVNDVTGVTPSGDLVTSLVDVRWYEGSEVSGNLIVSGSNGYTIQGKELIIAKNVTYLSPVTIIVTANYFDVRTGKTVRVHDQKTLSTTSLVEYPVTLELDRPTSWGFNPLSDSGTRTITVSLRLAGQPVASDRQVFWWYKVVSGVETLVDPNDDLFYVSGQNNAALVIDPRYINKSIILRCKAEYVAPGETAPSAPTSGCQKVDTTVTRAYPGYEYEIFVNGSSQISYSAEEIKAECIITKSGSVISNPESFFIIEWLIRRVSVDSEWKTIGYGSSVIIPKEDYKNGADIAVDLHELEPMSAAGDGSNVWTVNDTILTL